ncbi:MAG TPA: hypothetical protein VJK06_03920 [Methyloceanibacter sp.]|nr:hypothetical protein [Methyloceanibacter sp.]
MTETNLTIPLSNGNETLSTLSECSSVKASGRKKFTLMSTRWFLGVRTGDFPLLARRVRGTYRSCYNNAMGKPRSNRAIDSDARQALLALASARHRVR